MIFLYLLSASLILIAIGVWIWVVYRPEPFPDGIRGVTPYISTVHFETLEAEIVKQYSNQQEDEMVHLAKIELRCIQQRRLTWLAHQAGAMKANIQLYCSAASWELAQAADKCPSQYNDRERMAALILQTAPWCLLALMLLALQMKLASAMSHIRPYGQTLNRPLVLILHFVSRKYSHLTDHALTVAQSYGRVHYENLLAAL